MPRGVVLFVELLFTVEAEMLVYRSVTFIGFLKGGGCLRVSGAFLGNPKDSVWEDWGSPNREP